ncbi:hypothetical protein D3C72_2300580 [compost metagenome]
MKLSKTMRSGHLYGAIMNSLEGFTAPHTIMNSGPMAAMSQRASSTKRITADKRKDFAFLMTAPPCGAAA